MKELDIERIKSDLEAQFDEFAEKLEPVYKILNWKWASVPSPGIPKKSDIIRCLNELLKDVKEVDLLYDFPICQIGTGGLYIGYQVNRHNGILDNIELILKFEIDEGSSDELINYMKEKK